jgi:hypothetical protein
MKTKTIKPSQRKTIAEEVRSAITRLSEALQHAKDAKLHVFAYGIGSSKETRITEYTELYLSELYEKVDW